MPHERPEDLTPQERATVVAVEAWASGSHDVSEEEAQEHLDALSPQEWKRVEAVLRARVEASRHRMARLEEWT
jgi:hypothetical protein